MLAISAPVKACTLAGKSLLKFDPNEYVFIGVVVGFTEPADFDERKGTELQPFSSSNVGNWPNPRKTVGMKVRLTEAVHVPKKPADYFEVYEYDLGADCSTRGVSPEKLKTAFPLGSEVRIVSREAVFLSQPTIAGAIQLENRPGEMGSIALNVLPGGRRMTTATSPFDYKSYSYDMNRDSDSKYLLPSFEVRKDLLRLESLHSPAERRVILNRLFDVPRHADVALKSIFDTYAASQQEAEQLYDSYLKTTDPELYEVHKVLQRVTNELVRLGFPKKQADEAIMKAIEGGSKFAYDDLIKETVRILKSPK